MPLFLVSRTDHTDYDEYDAVVVRAGSEADALRIATHHAPWFPGSADIRPDFSGFASDGSNLTAERVRSTGPMGLILASFRAG